MGKKHKLSVLMDLNKPSKTVREYVAKQVYLSQQLPPPILEKNPLLLWLIAFLVLLATTVATIYFATTNPNKLTENIPTHEIQTIPDPAPDHSRRR